MSDSVSLSAYKRRLTQNGVTTIPEAVRKDAEMIMLNSWYTSGTVLHCKLYKHKQGTYGAEYEWIADEDVRFIRVENQNVKSNEVDFRIQFKPKVRYDIGTYIDIPDENGIMERWLICHKDNEMPFTRYNVLRCNYLFKWICDNHICQSYGVMRGVNSYSSGQKKSEHFSYVNDLNGLWLPTDDVSCTMEYDTRLIIGDPKRKRPIVWKVSSIEECQPEGISKFTLMQDFYNALTDYDEKYGYIADIKKDVIIEPDNPTSESESDYKDNVINCQIIGQTAYKTADNKVGFEEIQNFNVRIGKTYKFSAFYTDQHENILNPIPTEWVIEGLELDKDILNFKQSEKGYCTFKINKDYYLGNKRFVIKCLYKNLDESEASQTMELEVLA